MAVNPELDKFYRAIGAALHAWSSVETQLGLIFSVISDPKEHYKALYIFDNIISFDVRLKLCNLLMKIEDTGEVEQEMWKIISLRLAKSYKERHELAHFGVGQHGFKPPFISPFATNTKLFMGTLKELSEAQINERHDKFRALSTALFWFHREVMIRRAEYEVNNSNKMEETTYVIQIRAQAEKNISNQK